MRTKERCLAYLNDHVDKDVVPKALVIIFNKVVVKALFDNTRMVRDNLGLSSRDDMEHLVKLIYPHWFDLYLTHNGLYCFRIVLFSHLKIQSDICRFCKNGVTKSGTITRK